MKTRFFAAVIFTVVSAGFLFAPSAARAALFVVDNGHPAAADTNPGTADRPLRTINAAAQLARPADTIEVAPGVYRERVMPARGGEEGRPITYRARKPGAVVVKGSDVWRPAWTREPDAVSGGGAFAAAIFSAPIEPALFKNWREGRDPRLTDYPTPFHEEINPSNGQDKLADADKLLGLRLTVLARPVADSVAAAHAAGPPATTTDWLPVVGQVYANGEPLRQARDHAELASSPGSFLVNADATRLLAHLPPGFVAPSELDWEIAARDMVFAPVARRLGYIIVDGFIFEHAANQAPWPSCGMVSVRNGHHWIIRRCVIRHSQSIGLDIGGEFFDGRRLYGDEPDSYGHIVEDNVIHDHGLAGIYGYEVHDAVIRRNDIYRNNRLGFIVALTARWEEYAGIKLLHAPRVRVEDNLIHDNFAHGVWFDNQWQGSRVSRNLIVGNQFSGVFIEFGESPGAPLLIDNNIIAFSDEGPGVYCHDSSDIVVAHNLLYQNKDYGAWFWAVSPRAGPGGKGGARNNRVIGNVIYGNGAGCVGFPARGPCDHDNVSDHNLLLDKTWSRAGDTPTFSLHESSARHPVSKAGIVAQITAGLKAGGHPDAALTADFWQRQPARAITLSQWRAITGNDRHSLEGSMERSIYRGALRQFEFVPDDAWRSLRVPAVAGVTRDYFGRAYPADGAGTVAGPFLFSEADLKRPAWVSTFARDAAQNLIRKDIPQPGRQRLNLWPKMADQETAGRGE
ncbi:right-handed parallel beta-helix repeat-containing protein [Termitidicoccus mucosus]